ncbi:Photosystem I assembly protein Ycf3 [compost metagenome]
MNNRAIFKSLYIIILYVIIIFPISMSAQQKGSDAEVVALIEKGNTARDKQDYPEALEYYTKAEVLIEKSQLDDKLFFIKNSIGLTYERLSNYGEALGYYQQALDIAKTNKLQYKTAAALNNIGAIYDKEKDFDTAIEYYNESYQIAKTNNFDEIRAILAQNLSNIYNNSGNYKQARKYLDEVKNITASKKQRQLLEMNYAQSFVVEGKIAEAQKRIEKLMKEIDDVNDFGCYVCATELLSDVYFKQNKLDESIVYAKKALANADDLSTRINLYSKIAGIYTQKKAFDIALKYKDSVILNKDSLAIAVSRELFETNKVKLKVQNYENEIKINKEKYKSERMLFIIGIIFILTLSYFIYRALKNRILKQKQEKIIAENEQKIVGLEMEGLKNNIAEKNRKLSTKALYLSGRNELIEDVINSLAKIPEVFQNREVATYIKTLKEYLKTDAEWDDFINYFEQVNHDFFKALKTKHPQLTPPDIRFLCYIYMNLDIKEISTICGITSEAGRKRKQRIAKKMEVDIDDLHEYILKIS